MQALEKAEGCFCFLRPLSFKTSSVQIESTAVGQMWATALAYPTSSSRSDTDAARIKWKGLKAFPISSSSAFVAYLQSVQKVNQPSLPVLLTIQSVPLFHYFRSKTGWPMNCLHRTTSSHWKFDLQASFVTRLTLHSPSWIDRLLKKNEIDLLCCAIHTFMDALAQEKDI